MTGHWADRYVGLPAKGRWPCWALVRLVWLERLGFVMPSFEDLYDKHEAVRIGAQAFRQVPVSEAQEMDAVMMDVPGVRGADPHIGVVVKRGLVLHVELDRSSVIEPLRELRPRRILRGPWETQAS